LLRYFTKVLQFHKNTRKKKIGKQLAIIKAEVRLCLSLRSEQKKQIAGMMSRVSGRSFQNQMKIDIRRINIILDYYDEPDVFFGSGSDSLIITLTLSETNASCFYEAADSDNCKACGKVFLRRKKSIAVICNSIKEGHMFLDNILNRRDKNEQNRIIPWRMAQWPLLGQCFRLAEKSRL
jgi:hypothetical protein